jgi:hypothetical protein
MSIRRVNTTAGSDTVISDRLALEGIYFLSILVGNPRGEAMDCTMVAAAPVLPVGYVVSASRIADGRMILAGYRLAVLLMR